MKVRTVKALTFKPVAVRALVALVLLLGIAEIGVRVSGVVDFPVYAVDDEIGYIVKPNQSGRFLNRNSWAFNSKSMPTTEAWRPSRRPNLMLIGNSIVMGGNPLDEKDKLTPRLAAELGGRYAVWPLAIGGWTTVNEMVYMRRNPDVVRATDVFVWEYMSGGLSELSRWRGDYVFPSSRPVLASWYAFRRYVLPRFLKFDMNELPPVGEVNGDHRREFETAVAGLSRTAGGGGHPGLIFLYPTKKELRMFRQTGEWLPDRAAIAKICERNGLAVLDIAGDGGWNESLYRDGVHPTAQGNIVLAKILSSAIARLPVPVEVAK